MHNTVRDSSAPSLMTHCHMSIAPLKIYLLKNIYDMFSICFTRQKTRLSSLTDFRQMNMNHELQEALESDIMTLSQ